MTCWRACISCSLLLPLMAAGFARAQTPTANHTPAPAQQPASFDVLLDAFARMPGLEARFVEEKHLALLVQPLESRGRLFFAHPGLLLRRVEAPRRSDVVITPTELRMKDADGEQSIDLRSRNDIKPFVQSLTWLFAGDRKALAEMYAIAFEPARDGAPWRVTLTPKNGPIARLIRSIVMLGSGLAVSQIEVHETSGDETVTRIVEANPARHFTRDEMQTLFGVGP